MRGENVGAELKANILIEHEKRGKGALKVANKFSLDQSTVTAIFQKHRAFLKDDAAGIFSAGSFQKVEMPDESLQSGEQKIAFYKSEAENYKALSLALEKKLGLLLRQRNVFRAREIANVVANHEIGEVDGKWKMTHDEFMEFYSSIVNY